MTSKALILGSIIFLGILNWFIFLKCVAELLFMGHMLTPYWKQNISHGYYVLLRMGLLKLARMFGPI